MQEVGRMNHRNVLIVFQHQQIIVARDNCICFRINGAHDDVIIFRVSNNINR